MKLFGILLLSLVSVSAEAKIIKLNSVYYVESSPGKIMEIDMLNQLIKRKRVSDVTLYRGGKVNLISMKIEGQGYKLYSVANSGNVFLMQPYSEFHVENVDENNLVRFREVSNAYYIDENGTFIK